MKAIKQFRIAFIWVTVSLLFTCLLRPFAQTSAPSQKASAGKVSSSEFSVATIKPGASSGGRLGFTSYPSGRVEIGEEPLSVLMAYAFNVQEFQISGGPDWVRSDRYDLAAMPDITAGNSPKQSFVSYRPNSEQQLALQRLLVERFALKFHIEKRQSSAYVLTRGDGPLMLKPSQDGSKPQGAAFLHKADRIDGEAVGTNMTIDILAKVIGRELEHPVIDQTGLAGVYDFRLAPFDPSNVDISVAIFRDMERLGLKLKAGKGPVETVVIDSVQRPASN